MKEWRLNYQGVDYSAVLDRGLLNVGTVFSSEEMKQIIQEAFGERSWFTRGSELILRNMFKAGLCTGLSAWTLLKFAGETDGQDELKTAAVLQARILRPSIWQLCFADYHADINKVIADITEGFGADQFGEFPLLMIVPKLKYINKLAEAHTLVPYHILAKSNHYQIYVYDCNFPGNGHKMMTIDLLSGCWQYEHFNSSQWFLSCQTLKKFLCQ